MNINELETYDLADAVKFNTELNPRLWTSDEQLRPDVRNRLLEIADDFKQFLGISDIDLKDITISGSNAAYTYTPHSDIDLHLVVDFPQNDDVYRELFDAKKYQYNNQHNITIGKYPVELYVQNADQPHVSQGIYSVLNDEWIDVPKRKKADINDGNTRSKYDDMQQRIEDAIASGNYDEMAEVMSRLKKMRQAGLDEHGEFSSENLAFKMLRSQGVIGKLSDARNKAKDEELSLAEREKLRKPVKYGFGEDAGSTWDGVNPTTCMFLNETEPKGREEVVQDFIEFCVDKLKIDNPPKVVFKRDPEWSVNKKTFGYYDPASQKLFVNLVDRHIMDILRTVGHELVHARQSEIRDMPPGAGEDGSPWENEANAKAGVLMRKYGKMHPEYFEPQTVGESASGYIPTKAQAKDPRYSMALTKDVQPGALGKAANALALKTDSQGRPQVAKTNGIFEEMRERFLHFKKTGEIAPVEFIKEGNNVRFREFIRESQELDEVKMSPGALRQWASSPAAQGMLMGIEFEMVVPNFIIDPDDNGGTIPDFSYDRDVSSIEQLGDFFSGENNPPDTLDRLQIKYLEWIYYNLEDYAREIMVEKFDFGPAMEKARKELGDDADEDDVKALADDIVYDTISDLKQFDSDEWNEAFEEAEARYSNSFSEKDWLTSIGADTTLKAARKFNLEWPHYKDTGSALENLGDDVSQVVGAKVNTSANYHGGKRQKGAWVIETDSSILPHSDEDSGVEIVSPAEPIAKTLDSMNKLWAWANEGGCYTNDSTGLHMNISVPNFSRENLDYVKLALFMGDDYVLQQFDRVGNEYCRSASKRIKSGINDFNTFQLLNAMKKGMNAAASKIIHGGHTDKYTSINTRDGWVEFRGPGGNYLSKSPEELASTALRLAMALSIACDENAYKNEYNKKLYKLLAPKSGSPDTVNLFARYASGELTQPELKKLVSQIQNERKPEVTASGATIYKVMDSETGYVYRVPGRTPREALLRAARTFKLSGDNLSIVK
jgi:hypothetical protein